MAATVIKSATLTIGSTSYPVRELSAGVPRKVDEIDATALGDSVKWYEPVAQIEYDVMTATISTDSPPTVGSAATLSATLVPASGSNVTVTVTGYIRSVEPETISVDGNRVLGYKIEFRPQAIGTTTT